jgi:uncharacterized protein (UPF0218 family)
VLAPNEVLSSVGDLISRQVAELIAINSVCVVGPTQQRYTLKRRVATATTLNHHPWDSATREIENQ